MAKGFKLVDTTLLEKAMDAAMLRQQVITNNIANVNTEGYQARRVVFEDHLRRAMAAEEAEEEFGWVGFADPDLGITGDWTKDNLRPTIEIQGGRVDIHQEMSNLAKNQIMYRALADKISGIYGALKWIIDNSGAN